MNISAMIDVESPQWPADRTCESQFAGGVKKEQHPLPGPIARTFRRMSRIPFILEVTLRLAGSRAMLNLRAVSAKCGAARGSVTSELSRIGKRQEEGDCLLLYRFPTCRWAARCAPVSRSNPERNAQNIRLTDKANGP